MPRYTVSPKDTGKGWVVYSNGRQVSDHRKKARALDKARELAKKNNGHVTVQGANGSFQRQFTPR